MRAVTLEQLFHHHIVQKYVKRSGMAHAIDVAECAVDIAVKSCVNPDHAAKAGFLHDIGHYQWYQNGTWDFDQYKENDIHAIKGAERAHKLLIRQGEQRKDAKAIALAVLLHTDSYLPEGFLKLTPLQQVVVQADTKVEEAGGAHHYRKITDQLALQRITKLDQRIEYLLNNDRQPRT
ncbi:HD domain-containing protein [Amphibacillus jilinensis]|uniref:HD domain-containing protein n=1 Tax=Amphibacillus jilinensis TaxID=1216008 RepID=UPI0002E766B5|nr:HD domain-containing protein [Amphibacillus jilinensis]